MLLVWLLPAVLAFACLSLEGLCLCFRAEDNFRETNLIILSIGVVLMASVAYTHHSWPISLLSMAVSVISVLHAINELILIIIEVSGEERGTWHTGQ